MDIFNLFFLCLCVQIFVFGAACSKGNRWVQAVNSKTETQSAEKKTQSPTSTPLTTLDTSIRKIDFENMTYSGGLVNLAAKAHFKLTDGVYKIPSDYIVEYIEIGLVCVLYGDITDDGREEAITILSQTSGGTAHPYFIYIFSLVNKKPKEIWAQGAGSDGDGGLKDIFIENGILVIELYGKDTAVDGELADQDENPKLRNPRYFTQSRYKWNGKDFESISREVLPNPLETSGHFMCSDE